MIFSKDEYVSPTFDDQLIELIRFGFYNVMIVEYDWVSLW